MFRGILASYGIQSPSGALLNKLVHANIQNLNRARKWITSRNVLPHVVRFLTRLRKQGYTIGVISGNPKPKGEALLRFTGIAPLVDFTAFSDEKMNGKILRSRADILRLVLQRIARRTKQSIPIRQVYVIGDAPSDIKAGKEIGASTIGIATGNYTREQLEKHRPTRTISSFAEIPGVLARVTMFVSPVQRKKRKPVMRGFSMKKLKPLIRRH